MKNIPGPNHNPFLGNALDFLGNTENILPVLQRYTREYGPLVKIYASPAKIMLLATDEKFLEHMLSSNVLINKADHYRFLHSWLGSGLLTGTGTKWRQRRRMINPSFHFSLLENFVSIFEKNGDVLIKKLENEVGKNSFDIHPLINLCTLDIICESAMGTTVNAQQNETSQYIRSVKIMSKIAMERAILPIPDFLYYLTPNYFREKKVLKILHGQTDQVINKKINELNINDNKTELTDDVGTKKKMVFLDMLISSNIDGKSLSKTEIREEVDTFMFAGHDTVSSALSFTLFAIANNPGVQKKILEEQNKIFGDLKDVNSQISLLQEMKYLEMVIKESLRLYPPVAFLGRQFKEEHEWNGHIFPKNLNMILFIYDNMRNPKYFPDPLEFKPERFETQTGLNSYIYSPFSAGPRNCIGQKFAILEMKCTLSKIIRNYELMPANPIHHLKLVPDVVLISKNGVCISIKKRT